MGRRLVLTVMAVLSLTAPAAVADLGATTPPALEVSMSPTRFRVGPGTTFVWQASEPVEVGIRIEQRVTRTRFKRVGLILRNAPAGEGSFKFSGRIPGKGALKAGTYRAIVRASDEFDNKSEATTLRFRVLAR